MSNAIYLVHANWLQKNAFNTPVTLESITPSTTQIRLYQLMGLRKGGFLRIRMDSSVFGGRLVLRGLYNRGCLASGDLLPVHQLLRISGHVSTERADSS